MKVLNTSQVKEVIGNIEKDGRKLETYLLKHLWGGNCEEKFLDELEKYQNKDGGFGNGIEPDFWMPYSSPIATTVALEYLDFIQIEGSKNIVRKTIEYLQNTYDEERKGWYAADERVNRYPHAPWWNHKNGRCAIDNSWGNPTLKILGYLYKYRSFVDKLDLKDLLRNAIEYILDDNIVESEHEIYCLLSLYNNLPEDYREIIRKSVEKTIKYKIDLEEKAWVNYVPMPVNFIKSKEDLCYHEFEKNIEANLDFLINSLNQDMYWKINWKWNQYTEAYEKARKNWMGYLAVKNLELLKKFGRIEDEVTLRNK